MTSQQDTAVIVAEYESSKLPRGGDRRACHDVKGSTAAIVGQNHGISARTVERRAARARGKPGARIGFDLYVVSHLYYTAQRGLVKIGRNGQSIDALLRRYNSVCPLRLFKLEHKRTIIVDGDVHLKRKIAETLEDEIRKQLSRFPTEKRDWFYCSVADARQAVDDIAQRFNALP